MILLHKVLNAALLRKGQGVQECDATMLSSGAKAGYILTIAFFREDLIVDRMTRLADGSENGIYTDAIAGYIETIDAYIKAMSI